MKRELESCATTHDEENKNIMDQLKDSESILNSNRVELKLEKSRERNREHAKRTRQRKKEMMENLKQKLVDLQKEGSRLEQLLEESSTANILLCLGTNGTDHYSGNDAKLDPAEDFDTNLSLPKGNIIDQLRYVVRQEAAQKVRLSTENQDKLDGKLHSTEAATHEVHHEGDDEDDDDDEHDDKIDDEDSYHSHSDQNIFSGYSKSWKRGEVMQESQDGHFDIGAHEKSIGDIKRERNRKHAKLTRDRKKLFTSKLQQTIQAVEKHNQMIRAKLQGLVDHSSRGGIGRGVTFDETTLGGSSNFLRTSSGK